MSDVCALFRIGSGIGWNANQSAGKDRSVAFRRSWFVPLRFANRSLVWTTRADKRRSFFLSETLLHVARSPSRSVVASALSSHRLTHSYLSRLGIGTMPFQLLNVPTILSTALYRALYTRTPRGSHLRISLFLRCRSDRPLFAFFAST
jgi:hypothetical protein